MASPTLAVRTHQDWDLSINNVPSTTRLHGIFDFYFTRNHRFVVEDFYGHEIDVRELPDRFPRSHHQLSLPLVLFSLPDVALTSVLEYLAILGVDPVSRWDIAKHILSFIDDELGRPVVAGEFHVSVDLEVTMVVVVSRGNFEGPENWQDSQPHRIRDRCRASEAVISMLNAKTFVVADVEGAELGTCIICLDDLCSRSESDPKLNELSCGHMFHNFCIVRWVDTNPTCPLCRQELDGQQGEGN